jgi:hypothetical protein
MTCEYVPCLFLQEHNEPLFSSHMLDLSEEFDEENISTCVKYFEVSMLQKLLACITDAPGKYPLFSFSPGQIIFRV